MTVIKDQSDLQAQESALPLSRYAQLIGYSECSFFGVNHDVVNATYRPIWTKPDRDMVRKYLGEAQVELEEQLGHPLGKRWIADEQRPYGMPLLARWGEALEGGVRATTVISADEAVNHATDPAVIGPVATTVTDEDEIRVFYPVSLVEDEIEISPSDIDLDTGAGTVTIYVPRCRMVHPSKVDNSESGLSYTNLANFLSVVDVKRVYNDTSTQATLVWPHRCLSGDCDCGCTEYTQTGCIYVADGRIGKLHVLPASYSGGTWSSATACCSGQPAHAILNYRAGVDLYGADRWWLARKAEDALIRLAHSKMPKQPCGSGIAADIWTQDRNIPKFLSKERLNCPFGLSDGAWIAWRFVSTLKVGQVGVL